MSTLRVLEQRQVDLQTPEMILQRWRQLVESDEISVGDGSTRFSIGISSHDLQELIARVRSVGLDTLHLTKVPGQNCFVLSESFVGDVTEKRAPPRSPVVKFTDLGASTVTANELGEDSGICVSDPLFGVYTLKSSREVHMEDLARRLAKTFGLDHLISRVTFLPASYSPSSDSSRNTTASKIEKLVVGLFSPIEISSERTVFGRESGNLNKSMFELICLILLLGLKGVQESDLNLGYVISASDCLPAAEGDSLDDERVAQVNLPFLTIGLLQANVRHADLLELLERLEQVDIRTLEDALVRETVFFDFRSQRDTVEASRLKPIEEPRSIGGTLLSESQVEAFTARFAALLSFLRSHSDFSSSRFSLSDMIEAVDPTFSSHLDRIVDYRSRARRSDSNASIRSFEEDLRRIGSTPVSPAVYGSSYDPSSLFRVASVTSLSDMAVLIEEPQAQGVDSDIAERSNESPAPDKDDDATDSSLDLSDRNASDGEGDEFDIFDFEMSIGDGKKAT